MIRDIHKEGALSDDDKKFGSVEIKQVDHT